MPERSIVFLAVTGEESGLLGSKYYAENPLYPLARTAGGINMDGLNVVGNTRDFVVIGKGKSELEDYHEARRPTATASTVKNEPSPQAGYFYRSDHFSLAKQGVPMLYAEGGEDLVEGGVAAGHAAAEDYRANRYHQPSDEYDPDWNWYGRDPRPRNLLADRPRAGRFDGLAELVSRRRIPRHPRQEPRQCRADHAMTARQPPEWAEHEWVWIGFPSHADLWEDDLEPARREVAAFARAVHADGAGEEVRLVAADPASAARRRGAGAVRDDRPGAVRRHLASRHRADHPQAAARRQPRSFRFNGWGGKYELEGDDTVGLRLAEGAGMEAEPPRLDPRGRSDRRRRHRPRRHHRAMPAQPQPQSRA